MVAGVGCGVKASVGDGVTAGSVGDGVTTRVGFPVTLVLAGVGCGVTESVGEGVVKVGLGVAGTTGNLNNVLETSENGPSSNPKLSRRVCSDGC